MSKSQSVIDARYNLGLTKVIDQNENISNGAKNSVIMLTVGYKIPL